MNTIILDFDGTIGDTRSLIVRTFQQTLQHLGLPHYTDAQCAATIGLPLAEGFKALLHCDDNLSERCADVYRELFDENNHPGAVQMFPHVVDTIKTFAQRGDTVTIASSRFRQSLEDYVLNLGLKPYISYIVSACDVKNAKPAPDMVLVTLNHFQASKQTAWVVGDTTFDIQMGRSAGVKTVGVTYGNGSREDLIKAGATHVIDHFNELLSIIK